MVAKGSIYSKAFLLYILHQFATKSKLFFSETTRGQYCEPIEHREFFLISFSFEKVAIQNVAIEGLRVLVYPKASRLRNKSVVLYVTNYRVQKYSNI